jgi:hypothetical protein
VLVDGPVSEPLPVGTWGMALVDAPAVEDVEAVAHADPAVSSGLARFEIRSMPDAITRAQALAG